MGIQLISAKRDENYCWVGIKLIGLGYLILLLSLPYYMFLNSIVFDYLRISIRNYGCPLLIFHIFASGFAVYGLWQCYKDYKKQAKKQRYFVLPILLNLPLHCLGVSSFATFLQAQPL